MDERKRKANETEFDSWTDNEKGGRIYCFGIMVNWDGKRSI